MTGSGIHTAEQATVFPAAAAGAPACWLDPLDFGARTVRGGRELPWLQVSEFVDLLTKLDRLVGSDVVALPLGRLAQAYVESQADLRAAMGARSRPGYALRVLLAEPGFADLAVSLATALGSTLGGRRTIALTVPSPARWTGWANAAANDGMVPLVPDDVAEDSAVRVADFLRGFAAVGVGVVLAADAASPTATCEPIANVAHYYGAVFGIDADAPCADAAFVDFTVGDPGTATPGVRIPAGFWDGGEAPAPPAGGFLFGRIPPDAEPERVMARIDDLRRSGT